MYCSLTAHNSCLFPSFLSCNGEGGAIAAVLIVGYLQLKAGKHTQERLSLDEHNTRSKDESEVKLGTTCSWQLAVIATRANSTSLEGCYRRASFLPLLVLAAASVAPANGTEERAGIQPCRGLPHEAQVGRSVETCTRVTTNFGAAFDIRLDGSRVRATLSYVSRLCRSPTTPPLASRF